MTSVIPAQPAISDLARPPLPKIEGFDFPAPRYPAYLRQERTDDVEALLPLARSLVRRKYGRMAWMWRRRMRS